METYDCRYKAAFEAIKEDNPRVLATRTPSALEEKWRDLVEDCDLHVYGIDVGNGRMRRGRTTIPKTKWAAVARLAERGMRREVQ